MVFRFLNFNYASFKQFTEPRISVCEQKLSKLTNIGRQFDIIFCKVVDLDSSLLLCFIAVLFFDLNSMKKGLFYCGESENYLIVFHK